MPHEQHAFEAHIRNSIDYWQDRLETNQVEQKEHYRHYFAEYFTLREDMYDAIGSGAPLNGEGIVEYAEGLVRMDGASPQESSAYADKLAKVFSGSKDNAQPVLFGFQSSPDQQVFSPSNHGSDTYALCKNERLRDFNRLIIGSGHGPQDRLLVNGRYDMYNRFSRSDTNLWTAPWRAEQLVDPRFITIVDEPEEVERKMHSWEGTVAFVGEAALEALRLHLWRQTRLHVDAVSTLLKAQGIDLGDIETSEDTSRLENIGLRFDRSAAPSEQLLDFVRSYVATVASPYPHYRTDELLAAGIPAVLHPDAIGDLATYEEIQEAATEGFAETAQVITDPYKDTLTSRLQESIPLKIGSLVTDAARVYAEAVTQRLSQMEGGDAIGLDVEKVTAKVREDREFFRKLTLPKNSQGRLYPTERDDPVVTALRNYSKNSSFKKKR
jgi:hypothetical protein